MSSAHDPRKDISHPINIGQVYSDSRTGDLKKIIYRDQDATLLRDEDKYHLLESSEMFEKNVGSGRYKLEPDEEFGYAGRLGALADALSRYEGEEGRTSDHKAEALREALSLLTEETAQFEAVPFEDLDGVGSKTAARLRSSGYSTVEDIRRASDEELLDVGGIGNANLDSIREYVRNT